MIDSKWVTTRPALGEILVKLLTLKARLDRVEAGHRLQAIKKTIELMSNK